MAEAYARAADAEALKAGTCMVTRCCVTWSCLSALTSNALRPCAQRSPPLRRGSRLTGVAARPPREPLAPAAPADPGMVLAVDKARHWSLALCWVSGPWRGRSCPRMSAVSVDTSMALASGMAVFVLELQIALSSTPAQPPALLHLGLMNRVCHELKTSIGPARIITAAGIGVCCTSHARAVLNSASV